MRAHEFIVEERIKPTGNDSPQAWIDYFLTSTHPSLKGQDPETLKRMALAARNKAVHNPPKTKSTFKPSKPNPNARYWWQEKDEGIEVENFADGKKPGRKGLAKRSGVNTKASVSSLRKTAKNSTGEKARMAHWLANMKAGRAKAEDIEEDWKNWVASAAMGAASLGAAGDADAAIKKPVEKPAVVQQVKKQDIKKLDPLKQVSKKEISASVTGNPHEVVLKKAAEKAGIQGQELVAFLSQCAHETLDFKHMKEIGGKLDFKKYDIRFAPNKAKSLGNTKPGDGAKYAGRGYIQLTGKYNYAAASKAIYGDDRLVRDPSLVEKPEVAAKTSVWYWQNRVSNKVKNFDNVKDVTKGINPGMKHLDQRKDKFQDFKVAMR
jgi:putative chitinase